MKRKTSIKISRGRFEHDKRKSEDAFEYQKVALFILPLVMIAVLVVGLYFGYLSYMDNYVDINNLETRTVATEPEFNKDQQQYLLTVVSSAKPVDKDFVPELATVNGVEVSELVCDDLKLMLDDASENGLKLTLKSGYISFEEQKQKYTTAVREHRKKHKSSTVKSEAAVKKTTPNAGECEQQTGLLLRFASADDAKFVDSQEYRWLYKNCVNYGFVLRYPEKENTGGIQFSPSLFRYVGVENARLMRAYNMNLDEYVKYLDSQ